MEPFEGGGFAQSFTAGASRVCWLVMPLRPVPPDAFGTSGAPGNFEICDRKTQTDFDVCPVERKYQSCEAGLLGLAAPGAYGVEVRVHSREVTFIWVHNAGAALGRSRCALPRSAFRRVVHPNRPESQVVHPTLSAQRKEARVVHSNPSAQRREDGDSGAQRGRTTSGR